MVAPLPRSRVIAKAVIITIVICKNERRAGRDDVVLRDPSGL
jgi:hypothetical protein